MYYLNLFYNFLVFYLYSALLLCLQLLSKRNRYVVRDSTKGVAIVTGGSSGIGAALTKALIRNNYQVVIGSPSINHDCPLMTELLNSGKVKWLHLDLADVSSIQQFVIEFTQNYQQLNLLVNNAGIMLTPFSKSSSGVEGHLATNYLGHFILTHLLLDLMKASGELNCYSRVVNVSSDVHYIGSLSLKDAYDENNYSAHAAYAQSKLAQVMWTQWLNRSCQSLGYYITVNAVHPGIVKTSLYKHLHWSTAFFLARVSRFFWKVEDAIDGVLFICLAKQWEGVGGQYLSNCIAVMANEAAYDAEKQWILWKWTKEHLKHLNVIPEELLI